MDVDDDDDCPEEDVICAFIVFAIGTMHAVIVLVFDVGLGCVGTVAALEDSVSNILPGNSVEYDGGGSISS